MFSILSIGQSAYFCINSLTLATIAAQESARSALTKLRPLTRRIQPLEGNLLLQTTTALLVCPQIAVLGGQPTFQQPSAVLGPKLEAVSRQTMAR